MNKQRIKQVLFNFSIFRYLYVRHKEKTGYYIKIENFNLDDANKVLLDNPLSDNNYVGLVKDENSQFKGYLNPNSYYPKFERFLKNNNIKYDYFDIHSYDWLKQVRKFNIIVWRTPSSPAEQTEAMQKIFFLEKIGIKCFPSFEEVFKYEDKVVMHYFYQIHSLPEIETFVTYSKDDAIEFATSAKYPIVSKISTASASKGVSILRSKRSALKLINKSFQYDGNKTYWKYVNQKDYVYFQKFIDDAKFDLRVIVISDSLFGYYRFPNKGDFRASGAGHYEKKEIPTAAMDIAWETKKKYGSHCLATDFVYSPKDDQYYIIESSIFIGVETAMQLLIDGLPGRYIRNSEGVYNFEQGKYWIQELALKSFFESF